MLQRIRETSYWRHLLPILLPFVMFVLVAVWTANYINQKNHIAELSRQADHTMSEASELIYTELSRVIADIKYLAQTRSLQRYIAGDDNVALVGEEWQQFMLLKNSYDQIRLLDRSGMEKVRIDFHNGQPLIIPQNALQDKSERYYFQEAMALPAGDVYASAMDLNIERGVIIEPFQPTMRFAIKVSDRLGKDRGLLVINLSANQLLQRIRHLSIDKQQSVYLLNHQGYWLIGPNPELEWGFMFSQAGKPNGQINTYYPAVWMNMLKSHRGIEVFDDVIVGFQTFDAKSSRSSKIPSGELMSFNGSDFPWTVISVMENNYLTIWGNYNSVDSPALLVLTIFIAAALVVAVATSTWRLARKLHSTELVGQNARSEASKLQSILGNLQDGIFFVNSEKCIISCNPAAERLFGLEACQLRAQKIDELLPLLPGNKDNSGLCPMQAGTYSTEVVRAGAGERIPVDVKVYDLPKETSGDSLVIVHDARDRVDSEKRLNYIASHDLLTGLPNRFSMEDETRSILQNALRHNRQVALLHIDIDNFKKVIDTCGHRAGDEFLKRVAERLLLGVPENCQIGRLGNDEFIVIVSEIDNQGEAAELASQIISLMTEPFNVNTNTYHNSISIGISFAPSDSDSTELLFQHASTARYKAKSQGGNMFMFYDPVMNQEAKQLLSFENELREARTKEQFLLYYQPKYSIASQDLSGVEALLRWEHPQRGLLAPDAFIDRLEHTQNLLIDLGFWVLEEACNTIVQWNKLRLENNQQPLTMAVNFSSIQFRDPDMVSHIRSILENTGCDAKWLELEITESVLMDNLSSAEKRLWALHDTGIKIVIDDFGVGYSSLAYLKKLPVKVLKIDRSFVTGLPHDKSDCAIVEATVTMAKRLGLQVVVEGVETDVHFDFLKNLDIDYIQGYWYAKPMRKESVEDNYLHIIELIDVNNRVVALKRNK